MSITVATAVVAPSAPSSVAAPAALPDGAGDLAFQELLETFSPELPVAGNDSLPPAARAWTDRALLPPMPSGLARSDGAKAGPVRYGADAPLEKDGRSAQPADPSDQMAAPGNVLLLQALPLPMPASLPAVVAALGGDSAPAQLSGLSIATAADTGDRLRTGGFAPESRTSSTGQSVTGVATIATDIDGNAAARSTDSHGSPQAPGFGLQAADQTQSEARSAKSEARIVPTSPALSTYGANPAGESGDVRSGAGVRLTAARGGATGDVVDNPLLQATAAHADRANGTTSPALRPVGANAQPDRLMDGARTGSIQPAISPAEFAGLGPLESGIDLESGARLRGEQATRTAGSPTSADLVAARSTDLDAHGIVTPRDQAPIAASPSASTPAENPTAGAADRRSAAGVRLAAALARSARAEGSPSNRIASQGTTTPVNPDPRNVSTPGRVDVHAQTDGLADRPRIEPLTFGAAVSAAEQTPSRVAASESGHAPIETTPRSELALDLKASGLAAMFAGPVGVMGMGAPSTHGVPSAVATTTPSALDPAAESDLPRQIVQAMRLQWKDGIGDARIRLLPEYLGELSIAIRVEHGAVMAALEASTPAVRQWIESHEPMLRQSLAEQGLHLDRLMVSDEPEQTSSNPSRERRREKGEEPQQHAQPRRRAPAEDTTFEVIV
jgi:flagellar hook-length control protein FliK